MFPVLKKNVSVNTRHKIIQFLPKALRHVVIERYIAKQIATFENIKQRLGDEWITEMPGWSNTGLADTGKNSGEVVSNFWRTIPEEGNGNSAITYAEASILWDISWLKKHIDSLLHEQGSVLDFGCNAGRVLNVLMEGGYDGVGVEINPLAVKKGEETFPVLKKANFFIGEGSEVLPKVKTNSVDLIYSCAVLHHVAPEKIDAILDQFSRIEPKFIATMENEGSLGFRIYPHDYRKKFSKLGWKEIVTEYAIDIKADLFKSINDPIIINEMNEAHGLATVLRVYSR